MANHPPVTERSGRIGARSYAIEYSQPAAVNVTVVAPLVCEIVGVQSDGFGFNVTGVADTAIVIESCTNLANPVWVSLGNCTLTNGSLYFSDPTWTNYPGRFYRIRSP
jgi:hypothetical protein